MRCKIKIVGDCTQVYDDQGDAFIVYGETEPSSEENKLSSLKTKLTRLAYLADMKKRGGWFADDSEQESWLAEKCNFLELEREKIQEFKYPGI